MKPYIYKDAFPDIPFFSIKIALKPGHILSRSAPSDYIAVAVTLVFPSGSSSTSNPPEQCTTIVITNDLVHTTEEQDDYFNLLASSSDPSVFFTPGRKNVSVLIQDDDSKLCTCIIYTTKQKLFSKN